MSISILINRKKRRLKSQKNRHISSPLCDNLPDFYRLLPPVTVKPKRFHGSVQLETARVGRDASKIADEVIAHLSSLIGADVTVTLEIQATVPTGAPDNVVRTVTENCRTLKFSDQGFERE